MDHDDELSKTHASASYSMMKATKLPTVNVEILKRQISESQGLPS